MRLKRSVSLRRELIEAIEDKAAADYDGNFSAVLDDILRIPEVRGFLGIGKAKSLNVVFKDHAEKLDSILQQLERLNGAKR